MAVRKKKPKSQLDKAPPPTIHEAVLESGPSGAVLRGATIEEAAAVTRRRRGLDIVVCGKETKPNRRLALVIESGVGPCERQEPHDQLAGPLALPHFQQTDRSSKGHSFYETQHRKAKKGP